LHLCASAQDVEFSVQTGHSSEVTNLEFTKKGAIFASAGADNNIVLWDVKSGKQIRILSGHRKGINDLVFVNNDTQLISCSADSSIVLWDLKTGTIVHQVSSSFIPTCLAFDSIHQKVYFTAKGVNSYVLHTNEITREVPPRRKAFDRVFYLKDGTLIYGGGGRNRFYQKRRDVIESTIGSLYNAAFPTDEDVMIVASKKGNLLRYEKQGDWFKYETTLLSGYRKPNSCKAMVIKDSVLISMSYDNVATAYNVYTKKELRHYKGHYLLGQDVILHPGGDVIITSSSDGLIYLWDIESGLLIREFKSTSSSINFAKFDTDNTSLIIGFNNGVIKHWDLSHNGKITTHRFTLPRLKQKKGWRYSVLELVKQDSSLLTFKVALIKPYLESGSVQQCVNYTFAWDFKTGEKNLTEVSVNDYNEGHQEVEDVIVKENKRIKIGNKFWIAKGRQVTLNVDGTAINQTFETDHTSDIRSIAYNAEKKIYVTAGWDGKILMYNEKFERIASLVTMGNQDFVILVKDNYYFATKGALRYVGFVEGTKIHSFQQFDLFYNRPDIVYEQIPFANRRVLANYKILFQKRASRLGLSEARPDVSQDVALVDITSKTGNITKDKFVDIRITARDKKNLTRLFMNVDGVPYFGVKGKGVSGVEIIENIAVELKAGVNKIDVWVENEARIRSNTETILINSLQKIENSTLFFVGIGVSEYQDTTMNLKFATKDITDVSKLFKKSKICKKVESKILLNQEVVRDSLRSIRKFISQAGVDDVVIVYFAGHGMLSDSLDYYLASYNTDFSDPSSRGIGYVDLENELLNCKSRKKLLFLDACHSGEVDKDAVEIKPGDVVIGEDIEFRGANSNVVNNDDSRSLEAVKMIFTDLKENNGITVISSAGGADYALESDLWNNGAFTHSLVSGLRDGTPDLDRNGVVTIYDLLNYLQIDVPRITNGYQVPTYRSENVENDFVIWVK
jgi:WD40 repeat protein